MTLHLSIWSLVLILGAIQGLLLFFIIFFKKKGTISSNRVFAVLVLVLTIIQIDHSLRLSELYRQFPSLIYISDSVWYLIAPLLFYYTKFQINKIQKLQWIEWIHLIPFIAIFILYFSLLTASPDLKIQILESYKASGEYSTPVKFLILFMSVQMLGYLSYSLYLIIQYEHRFKNLFSNNHIMHLTALKRVYIFFLVYFFFEIFTSTYRNFSGIKNQTLDNWSMIVWVIFIYTIAYKIINQPNLIFPTIPTFSSADSSSEIEEKDQEDIEQLLSIMEEEKPYLNSDLKLPDLATKIDSTTHRVSHLINKKLGVNFYEFVNTYRIKDAKERLGKPEYKNLTIAGIANETGFKSKASFYKFFRKEYGMTPTEYLAKEHSK